MLQCHIVAHQYPVLVHIADQPLLVCHHIQFISKQIVDRYSKIICQRWHHHDIRLCGIVLPLGYGLMSQVERICQFLLGHAPGFAQLFDRLSNIVHIKPPVRVEPPL